MYIIHVYNFMSLEVNIHQLKLSSQSMTQTYPSLPKISSHPLIYYYYYYLVIRTLNIRSILRKTQSIQYSIANYWHYCQCISRTFSSCIAKTSYPLINISCFSFPLAPGNPSSTLYFYKFDYFRFLIYIVSCSMYLSFLTGLFCIA